MSALTKKEIRAYERGQKKLADRQNIRPLTNPNRKPDFGVHLFNYAVRLGPSGNYVPR